MLTFQYIWLWRLAAALVSCSGRGARLMQWPRRSGRGARLSAVAAALRARAAEQAFTGRGAYSLMERA